MELKRLLLKEICVDEIAQSFVSESISLDYALGFCLVGKSEDVSIAPIDVDAAAVVSNLIVSVGHGMKTGLKVRATSTGSLPTGISQGVDYYIIRNSADIFSLATSQENAVDGILITLTGGSGVHTFTIQPSTPVNVSVEQSIDNEIWVPLSGSTSTLRSTPIMLEQDASYYHSVRVRIDCDGGQHNVNVKLMLRGNSL